MNLLLPRNTGGYPFKLDFILDPFISATGEKTGIRHQTIEKLL